MPSHSDLYESDDEFAVNSPSDGYFSQRYSPNVLVSDPSLDDSCLDKAREARQEETSSGADESANTEIGSHRRPSQSASPTSYRRRIEPAFEQEGHSERSPLLSAPPPYSAADNSNRRSDMGQLEAFPQYSRPQDMGGREDPETLPELWRQRLKHYFSDHYGRLRRTALILTAVLVGAGFIANAVVSINHQSKTIPEDDNPRNIQFPDIDRACHTNTHSRKDVLTFERPRNFAFSQRVEDIKGSSDFVTSTSIRNANDISRVAENAHVYTNGEVRIRVADNPSSKKSLSVEIEWRSSDAELLAQSSLDTQDESLVITTPRTDRSKDGTSSWSRQPRPCISIFATIWITPSFRLSDFRLDTESLSVMVQTELDLDIYDATSITAPSNTVFLGSFKAGSPSRKLNIDALSTTIEAISGTVSGDFILRDSLVIHTVSGSIDINLTLLNGSDSSSSNDDLPTALLDLKSISGTIKVDTKTIDHPSQIPASNYHSKIITTSGSVHVKLVHGTSTEISSDSGSIAAALYPVADNETRSDIRTRTWSGQTDVVLHASPLRPAARLGKLHAMYRGASGALRTTYPPSWEGTVEGEMVSGSIRVEWPGLRVVRRGGGWGSRELKAVKGEGEGVLGFKGVSGSVTLKG